MNSRNYYNDADKQKKQKEIIHNLYGLNKKISKNKLYDKNTNPIENMAKDDVDRFAEISPELSREQVNEVVKNMLNEKEKEDYDKNFLLYKREKQEIVNKILQSKKGLLSGERSAKGQEYRENLIKTMVGEFANIPFKQSIKEAIQEIKIMMDEKEENNNCIMNFIYNL
jgi:hypothetical protein